MTARRRWYSMGWILATLALVVFSMAPAASSPLVPSAPPGAHIDIGGPVGSGSFGWKVIALPNGNIVVSDPFYDDGGTADVGAVYLLDGSTGIIIQVIYGSQANDQVGIGVWMLKNGNYVITSYNWDNDTTTNAGAVTWCSGAIGCSGVVSASNSLVGSHTDDRVGYALNPLLDGDYVVNSYLWNANRGASTWCNGASSCIGVVSATNSLVGSTPDDQVGNGLWELSNGNYVIRSYSWDSGTTQNVGSATWCSGSGGCVGAVSASNSLVGSTLDDQVGSTVGLLENGNYLVRSYLWDNGGITDAGAVTWCNGTVGCTGAVTTANSLVGSSTNDQVGGSSTMIYEVANNNYVVTSSRWDNGPAVDAGAVTWCPGTTGCVGAVTSSNSLVGSHTDDFVGNILNVLSNGSYVVSSGYWDNNLIVNAGASTWCHGWTGCQGVISASNSLVGGTDNDQVGEFGVVEVSGGRYVVGTPYWDRGGTADAGAATLCNGPYVCLGNPSTSNSLVGSKPGDQVGNSITPLDNGNYIVSSVYWDNGSAVDAGIATFCNGSGGCIGEATPGNSLVGDSNNDSVGSAFALRSGNYVVATPTWDNGGIANIGAATFCSGVSGCVGSISTSNSLIGSHANDMVGDFITPLSNGNYVVSSSSWGNGVSTNLGAITPCNGNVGCTGVVAPGFSLVGSTTNDYIGFDGIVELKSGNYVVLSRYFDNGSVVNAGAVTLCSGVGGCGGVVSNINSLVGSQLNDRVGYASGPGAITILNNGNYLVKSPAWDNPPWQEAGAISIGNGFINTANGPIGLNNSVIGMASVSSTAMPFTYDYYHNQLVVGKPIENVVSLFRAPFYSTYLPLLKR